MSDVSRPRLWLDALRGFYRKQVPMEALDPVSRWLYAGRFLILVISAQAAGIAALLAIPSGAMNGWLVLPLLFGFVIAHAISNLSNDYFGFVYGHDTPDSPRVTYTIHPLAHNVLTKRALRNGIWFLWALAAVIGAFFFLERGWPVLVMFAAGAGLLFLYDAAPTSLKSIGLGEAASFLVWGPLMVGGGYLCLTGRFSWSAVAAGVPYGLGIAGILIGKHIDQAVFDGGRRINTLPVLIGQNASRFLNQSIIVSMYVLVVVLAALRFITPFSLVVFLNVPAAWRLVAACASPRPAVAPEGYVGWPLWFHRFNLVHNRRFGWLYIGGLALGAAWSLGIAPLLHT